MKIIFVCVCVCACVCVSPLFMGLIGQGLQLKCKYI